MKVLDLRCANHHLFEGWFASDADFESQGAEGRIECPMCGASEIARLPSAPRLNVAHMRDQPASAASSSPTSAQMQSLLMKAVRHVMANTEDVGTRFPEEVRRIHYGEVEQRGIRGQASADEALALREEGIDVMPLPVPEALKGPLQ